jgi:subtilisin-like proprotein convertase family protein
MRVLIAAAVAAGCTSFEIAREPEIVESSRQPAVAIPDATDAGVTDSAPIDRACSVASVEVDVAIEHSFRGDVFVELISPAQTLVRLKETTDDSSPDVIGTFPTTLMPMQPLDTFAGEEGMGAWLLRVGDRDVGDVGTLESWTLRLGCL